MLVAPDRRVSLSDPQTAIAAPALETVFVGRVPDPAIAVQPTAAVDARAAAAQLGFGGADDPGMIARPLAFTSAAGFLAAFPGDDGWLSRAVQDYFAAGGKRAWVVRIEVDAADPLPAYVAPLPPLSSGVEIAMSVPSAGLLALPDLERTFVEAATPPPAIPPRARTAPVFQPVRSFA